MAQGFQIIWPQNSVDLLKFIEHNPRICGVIFDWDEYSLDLCSDINQLNEYLPLYAFINTHSTMDVSVQDMRMALWFFEYALGQAEDIAIRMRQYTNEYLDNITPPFTKALFTYVKERKYTFCTPGHMGGTAYQKSISEVLADRRKRSEHSPAPPLAVSIHIEPSGCCLLSFCFYLEYYSFKFKSSKAEGFSCLIPKPSDSTKG